MSEKINLAFKHFQGGSLEQAEKDCLEILSMEPENGEILHLAGVTFYHSGALDRAVEYLKRAIAVEDQNADVFYDLGNVLQDQGNLDEALVAYQQALDIEPEHPDAHNNIGMVLHDLGMIERAIPHYQKASELSPHSAMIHNNIALAYQENNEFEKAIAHFGRAIQLEPNYADAYYNMANIFVKEEDLDKAFLYFQKAIQINPDIMDAYGGMGNILVKKGRFAEALPFLGKALMCYPDDAQIHNSIGNALSEVWHLNEALQHLERAVQLYPDFAEAHSNLGNVLGRLGRLDEGIEHLNRALQLNPGLVAALNNLGNIFKEKGQLREAGSCYQKVLLIEAGNADAHFNVALLRLFQGDFRNGWEEYEWRWKVGDAQKRNLHQPVWDGSSLEGKSLFIYSEQGIGDEIMFASCFPEIIAQADRCVIECDERLVALFSRSFPNTTVIRKLEDRGYPSDLPPADFRMSSGSLPRFLRPDLGSFPEHAAYLMPESSAVEMWGKRYGELGKGLKVGISWRGGGKPEIMRVRSTALTQWEGLLKVPQVHFVNLQYGDCVQELTELEQNLGVKIHDWQDADPIKDLDAFAAKISALDLVVSVDNATVHMAGALGVPVWVLLPHICDWRWMQDFEDTPWYQRVRLFRQDKPGEWEGVFERALTALRDSATEGKVKDIKIAKSYKTQSGS